MNQAERALEDYNKALDLNPKDAVGYNNRGLVQHERNELEKALEDYSRAISLDPENPIFFENRALAHATMGRDQEALTDYEKALSMTRDEDRRNALRQRISVLEKRMKAPRSESPSAIIRLDDIIPSTPPNRADAETTVLDRVPTMRGPDSLPFRGTRSGRSVRVQ
jgi:tetratricopeptide (TPR) repeat protein